MAFQQNLNREPNRAVAGDFASTNPRINMLAGDSSLRAFEPILVGGFAFADADTGLVYQDYQVGLRVGFVHRNNQAIVGAGASFSMEVPEGRETALFTGGDFYCYLDDDVNVGDPVSATMVGGAPSVEVADDIDWVATPFVAAYSAPAGSLVKITTNAI